MIQKHLCEFEYEGRCIQFALWSNLAPGSQPVSVVFLGTSQVGKLPYWVARAATPGTIVVQGAPHWQAQADANGLFNFMQAYSVAALCAVRDLFDISRVHMVAESQAAPGAVLAALELDAVVNNIVLIAPLGFCAETFGATQTQRLRVLCRRTLRSVLQLAQSPLYDPRNLYAAYMILRGVLAEEERRAARTKYAAGLSYDLCKDCGRLLAASKNTRRRCMVLLGTSDRLFPPNEVVHAINAAGLYDLTVQILPKMAHSSLATRGGRRALRTALQLAQA